jgi:hypothetical protein
MSDENIEQDQPQPRPATPTEAATARARAMPNRIVVVEMVYFQSGTEDPVACEARYERRLASDDTPYSPPRITVHQQYKLLDMGWLAGSPLGLLHLKNEGPGLLLLCSNDDPPLPLLRVRPGESFRGEPVAALGIVLTCPVGHCKVKYTLFPG